MHRNTFILVLFLGIFAALVAGVNLGRKLGAPDTSPQKTISEISPTLTVTPTPQNRIRTYANKLCGFSVTYPDSLSLSEESSVSAVLTPSDTGEIIVLACQKDIPRPAIPAKFIETKILSNTANSATISAKLYHDRSEKDGSPHDALIYFDPRVKTDVFIAGYGSDFDTLIQTLRLL